MNITDKERDLLFDVLTEYLEWYKNREVYVESVQNFLKEVDELATKMGVR